MKELLLTLLAGGLLGSIHAKSFIYCSEASPSAFNPQITTDGSSNNAAAHTIYERLLNFKYGTTEVVPELAQSYSVSKDKKTYTFKLRKGVKWHSNKNFKPTRDFNADDVLFSINRMLKKDHPYHKVGGGGYEYFKGMDMHNLLDSVKKTDDHTIQIILKKVEAPFVANLAMSFMSILSKEYADYLEKKGQKEKIDWEPIGTGPFIFKKYVKDAIIRYNANPNYWGDQPKVKKLIFAITPDASVRTQKLKAGECHLSIEPAPADIALIKKEKGLKVLEAPGFNVGYLAFNTQKPPFNKLEVRKAIAHAINRDNIIRAIYLGNAVSAKNPLPPSIWSYNKKTKGAEYSLKKAKEWMAKSGMKDGFETELWTLPVTRPYNPNGKKMGELIQADLAKIGIKVKLVTYDWPTYLKKARSGEHQMIQLGWTGDNGDPDNFLHVLLGCSAVSAGSNVARWCHKKFDNLILEAKQITQTEKRAKLYQQAQEIFQQEMPWVPIAHSIVFRAMSNRVKGYKMDPLGGDKFKWVHLE